MTDDERTHDQAVQTDDRPDPTHYGDPEDDDAQELHGEAPLCDECDEQAAYQFDGGDLCPEHITPARREAVQRARQEIEATGKPLPPTGLVEFATDTVRAHGGHVASAAADTLTLRLPSADAGDGTPAFPSDVLVEASSRGFEVERILWSHQAVTFYDPEVQTNAGVSLNVPAGRIDEYQADDRGRITLGMSYAGAEVTAAILDDDLADE